MSAPPTSSPTGGRTDVPATTHLAIEIRILLSIIGKLNLRAMEQRVNESLPGMSLLQYGLLRILASEPCTLSELSNRMMLTPSTLVPAVDKLEREGYVVRGKDPSDRRRTPLTVTNAGRQALQAVPPFHDEDALMNSVRAMGPARAESLRALLHELLMGMSDDRTMIEDLLANHPERKCLHNTTFPPGVRRR
ncbi:MAG: MarR family transcriptional regulator [Anaerolineae bacterium]|jgi:DNA-binding MarR family transcriptional regulator|nr:MarR family transcriptional regulator [Anaerolineae bacterium]